MRFLRQLKPVAVLFVFLAAWWVTPLALKRASQSAFYEFQAPMIAAQGYAKDLQTFWALRTRTNRELIKAGRDLARINATYEVAAQEARLKDEEIARLENLLNLPSRPEFRY